METPTINQLKIYFGDPYPISDKVTLYQPTVNDVIENEEWFWICINSLTATSTSYRLQLWDSGIDWNTISNYEMFCVCVNQLRPQVSRMFFGDNIDFTKFQLLNINGVQPDELKLPQGQTKPRASDKRNLKFHNFEKMHTFYNQEDDIQINAEAFHLISGVVSEMIHIQPKNEYAIGKMAKEFAIQDERNLKIKNAAQMKSNKSTMQPLISMCVNHPGFKYNIEETRNLKISQLMDSASRLRVYEATHALLIGSNTGFIDTSKIPLESFDFMRSIN